MKINASTAIAQVKPEEVQRFVDIALSQIVQAINGRLSLQDNFDSQILTVTIPTADVDVAVSHGLGRVPQYYVCLGSLAATTLYDGSGANTASTLYLRATVATTARVWVF